MSVTGTTVTHNQRWIELEGADNTRDLGGLAVVGGGRTRFRRLLRAGTLQDLTAGDVAHLTEDLDVRTVVDLRLAEEAAREGSALSGIPAVRYFSLPLSSAGNVRSDIVADGAEMDIVGHYVALLEGSAANIVTAARIFADGMSGPAIFHCAAGKDRTGVLAAVLLDAVGVGRETIIADYALSGQRMKRISARLLRLATYRDMQALSRGVKGAATADEESMAAFLGELHSRYGGGAGYLTAHGMTAGELAALRAALTEP
ncbi:MAG TPA: tyrosine-protein phosphatase [Streptosporangiaceae bacterium]|nr:tyrosine-protein phosphatase [Streptosporangiaceae bacterium]